MDPMHYSSSMLRIHRYSSALKPFLVNWIEPLVESEKRPHADIGNLFLQNSRQILNQVLSRLLREQL
jgi:hypothetical protein